MNDLEFLISENEKKPVNPPQPLISEYIDGHRIMPPNTPFPGPVDISRTPYAIEPMDDMSPASPIREIDIMKGAQVAITWTAENVLGYWMDSNPTDILYVTADQTLLDRWATKRLEPLIDSIGMRPKISAQTENTKTRRTGDKTFAKEFVGGSLDMASAQAAGSLRSDSKRLLIVDEVDGAPAKLRTGEGNYLDVVYARTNAFGDRKKIMRFSTPTTFEDSLIYRKYELGDQRKYFMPCPHCGTEQELDFYRLKPVFQDNLLLSVYYDCINSKCDKPIYNHHKTDMLSAGKWKPTSISQSKYRKSYHISSLYSPVGMLSWLEIYQLYQDAQLDPDGMRSFTNLYLGLPFKESGSRPNFNAILEQCGSYASRDIPDNILYLTVGIDVQRGSAKDDRNPPRLEMEVLGTGTGYRTASIEYKIFLGDTSDASSGAWEKMYQWAQEGGLKYVRSDGMIFYPQLILIDSGDGANLDSVYDFCARWPNTYPSKGFQVLKRRTNEKLGDEATSSNFIKYRAAKTQRSADVLFYEISTNYYKTRIYNNLKVQRIPDKIQKARFCDFPRDYTAKYFKGLTAEEKHSDNSFHAHGRRNEPLDCKVMGTCAGDIFLDAEIFKLRTAAKKAGANDQQLKNIDSKFVLDIMTKNLERKPIPG